MGGVIKFILIFILVVGVGMYLLAKYHPSLPTLSLKPGIGYSSLSGRYSSGSVSGFSLPAWNPVFSNYSGFSSVLNGLSGGYYSGNGYGYQLPQGMSPSQISPYYGQVKIGGVSSYLGFSNQSYAQLYSYLPAGVTVDITGWHIKGNRGDVSVPQAVNFYDYTGLAPDTDIILSGNSIVYMYGNVSAIARNLRLNKCTGFLNLTNTFNPPLPNSCPALYTRDQIVGLSGYCQSYILSLGSCRSPSASFYNSLPADNQGNACRDFLNTLTPKSCYDNHRSDRDFLSNTWMLWINQNAFDPLHDQLTLYDTSGKIVDQYTY